MVEPQVFMELSFNIIYLSYILIIVVYMAVRLKIVKSDYLPIVKRFLLGYTILFMGDIAHVGLRLYLNLTETLETAATLEAIGSIVELISMYCLIICLFEAWTVRFNKPRGLQYWGILACGIVGIILILLPQNEWTSENPPAIWSTIRIVPWIIACFISAILMIKEGNQAPDKMFTKIGMVIIPSTICYSAPALFPGMIPGMAIGLIMIIGTILWMIMEYAPIKQYYRLKS